jgi:hypothetical protein
MNWKLLLAGLLLPLTLTSCTGFSLFGKKAPIVPEPIVITQTEYLIRSVPLQPNPKPVTLYDINFYAVTEENLDDFLEKFGDENGAVVFFAISVPDYENIALNMGELRRFIEQQGAIILYYEENINEKPEEADEQITTSP